jgi:hypothetical protein
MAPDSKTCDQDKHWAAVHEAAHLAVSFALGVPARAEIWPVDAASRFGDRTWAGEATAMRSFASSPAVGMAGYVAECLDGNPSATAEGIAQCWWRELEQGSGSTAPTTDEHRSAVQGAIKSAMEKLAQHRRFYEWAVNELMSTQSISDTKAADAFKDLQSN